MIQIHCLQNTLYFLQYLDHSYWYCFVCVSWLEDTDWPLYVTDTLNSIYNRQFFFDQTCSFSNHFKERVLNNINSEVFSVNPYKLTNHNETVNQKIKNILECRICYVWASDTNNIFYLVANFCFSNGF